MKLEFPQQRKIIIAGLALFIAGDLLLAVYSMQSDSRYSRSELPALKAQMKLLKADVQRAQGIRQSMPQTMSDCERFETSLFPNSAGYSAVTNELAEIANHSQLQIASMGFRSKELPSRNLEEVEVDATVTGDYKGVVQFLNGLQRSHNSYIVDGLTLASESSGSLRVALHLRSYFKNAA